MLGVKPGFCLATASAGAEMTSSTHPDKKSSVRLAAAVRARDRLQVEEGIVFAFSRGIHTVVWGFDVLSGLR